MESTGRRFDEVRIFRHPLILYCSVYSILSQSLTLALLTTKVATAKIIKDVFLFILNMIRRGRCSHNRVGWPLDFCVEPNSDFYITVSAHRSFAPSPSPYLGPLYSAALLSCLSGLYCSKCGGALQELLETKITNQQKI